MLGPRSSDFARAVYKVLVQERKKSLKEVAQEIGLNYDTLYARVIGRSNFSLDDVNKLLQSVPDRRLIDEILRDTDFIAVERDEIDTSDGLENVRRGATNSVIEVTDVLKAVEHGMEDERLDHQDRLRILMEIQEAERALASLRVAIEGN